MKAVSVAITLTLAMRPLGALVFGVLRDGNLLASANATLQAAFAERHGGDYALSLAIVGGASALSIAVLVLMGREARDVEFGPEEASAAPVTV